MHDILIVEDDHRVRRALERALIGEGYTVATAGDGAAALADLTRSGKPPKLIILDLLMPVMDGWQFRQRLLQQPEWALVPVIIFSGTGYESGDSRLPNVVSIPKPVRLKTLFAEVSRLIAGQPLHVN